MEKSMFKKILLGLSLLLTLTGCVDESPSQSSNNNGLFSANKLKVIAGSELKDIEPKLTQIKRATGIQLEMHYIGTLDGADKIVNGHEKYDLAWFSHAKYLSLLQGQEKIIKSEEKIGLSPVIPAVKESLARKWGWIDNPNVTWADIAEKSNSGEFKYAMTDPTASNTGFSTVIGVQAALSGSSDAFSAKDVDTKKLKSFFSGQELTSGSSGWLAQAYVRDQRVLDGLFNYESVLMNLNRSGRLKEKLVLVYPKEGVVTADYPLILLNDGKRQSYDKVVAYLKSKEFQQWMMDYTDRRPVNRQVVLSNKFPDGFQLELPFPSQLSTVNEILFSFLDHNRKPSHSTFVLDVSGSMGGSRMRKLKSAMLNLTGEDRTLTGQFAKFRNREKVSLFFFNHKVTGTHNFIISDTNSELRKLRSIIQDQEAGGGTAIYDSLSAAYTASADERDKDNKRFYSIVLMSDGSNTDGMGLEQFVRLYKSKASRYEGIRVFPVVFGNADSNEMKVLAELTGGKVFDANKHSLSEIFKKIRGYQ